MGTEPEFLKAGESINNALDAVRPQAYYKVDKGLSQEADPENAVPKVSMDYFFLVGEGSEAVNNPMFVMADEDKGHRYARLVEQKGLGEGGEMEWLILHAAEEIRSWAHRGGIIDPQMR